MMKLSKKVIKSERKTFKISLENKSCTCVRFEMCHHLVAVALAEGKELRGLDLSKVLVSKQRQKLNKKLYGSVEKFYDSLFLIE